jgi:hypothetical protein
MKDAFKIVVDGVSYERIEDLPAAARERYESAMRLLQDLPQAADGIRSFESRHITINGERYDSIDDIPEPLRELLGSLAIDATDRDRVDAIEAASEPAPAPLPARDPAVPRPATVVVEKDAPKNWLPWSIAAIAVAGMAYFALR